VIGRCGDIDGVWIEPVTAQVMMTLRALAMGISSGAAYGVPGDRVAIGPSPDVPRSNFPSDQNRFGIHKRCEQ
jgi:hypothetical protein